MHYSSKLIELAVNEIAQLPSIGRKSALRLVLHLLKQPKNQVFQLTETLNQLVEEIQFCKKCHNISDSEICEICNDNHRISELVCVVEDMRDVMAIESTTQFKGLYHVLGGKISPIEGVGPHQLEIASLVKRVGDENIKEIVLALSSTIEGDTTNFYIYKQLEKKDVKISTLSKGIAVGGELQYADEITLGQSIVNRIPFEKSLRS